MRPYVECKREKQVRYICRVTRDGFAKYPELVYLDDSELMVLEDCLPQFGGQLVTRQRRGLYGDADFNYPCSVAHPYGANRDKYGNLLSK